jgi:hypothetical protein
VTPEHPLSETEDARRSIKRLLLAAQDMNDCSAAAAELLTRIAPSSLARALETAIVVCYARPWGRSNRIGALEARWGPETPEDLALHEELIRLRDKVYAHTDDEIKARDIEDMSELLGTNHPVFAPGWHPIETEALPRIAALAEAQRARFLRGARELSVNLTR